MRDIVRAQLNFRGNFDPLQRPARISGVSGSKCSLSCNLRRDNARETPGNVGVYVNTLAGLSLSCARAQSEEVQPSTGRRRSIAEERKRARARRIGDLYPSLFLSLSPSLPPPPFTPSRHPLQSASSSPSYSFGRRSPSFPPSAEPPIDNWRCVPQDKRP